MRCWLPSPPRLLKGHPDWNSGVDFLEFRALAAGDRKPEHLVTHPNRERQRDGAGPGLGDVWKAHGIRQLPRFGRYQPQRASLQHFGVKAEPLTTSLNIRSTPEVPARGTSGERIGRTFPRRPRRAETPPPAFLIGQEHLGAERQGAGQGKPVHVASDGPSRGPVQCFREEVPPCPRLLRCACA